MAEEVLQYHSPVSGCKGFSVPELDAWAWITRGILEGILDALL